MKAIRVISLLAVLLTAAPSHAEETPGCVVPAYLLATENALPKVGDAIRTRKRLEVLVVGSGSSALPGADGASMSYPARTEAALREALSGVNVSVKTDLRPKKTAAEAAQNFGQIIDKLPADQKPDLVIWQTGTVDAIRAIDPDDFRAALDTGVEALQKMPSCHLVHLARLCPHRNLRMALAHPPAVRPLKDSLLPHGRFLVEQAMREQGLTVTGLANGVAVTCSVSAVNGAGTGPATAAAPVMPSVARGACGVPGLAPADRR